MSKWFCQLKAEKTGKGVCEKQECSKCKYHEEAKKTIAAQKRPKTIAFLRQKIEQKKTHIQRERERLGILLDLLREQEEV